MEALAKIPRPKNNKEILEPVIDSVAKEVQQWLNDGSDLEDIKHDVEKIVCDEHLSDGYELARELEDACGYSPDSELVNILDSVFIKKHNALKDAEKKWVVENDIKPKFKLGESVEVSYRLKKYTGEIADIDEKDATYTVYVAALGHVKNGIGTHGIVYKYEDIEK